MLYSIVYICLYNKSILLYPNVVYKYKSKHFPFVKYKVYICVLIIYKNMKDRIKLIMDNEHLTPSAFADKLQLGRAVISHILNGRNNPSLDVVSRILSKMDYIDSDWLLTGNGKMYKTDNREKSHLTTTTIPVNSNLQPDLFFQNEISQSSDKPESEYRKEIIVEKPQKTDEDVVKQSIIYQKAPERKVTKIIIYYSDNTFETFNADNKPL